MENEPTSWPADMLPPPLLLLPPPPANQPGLPRQSTSSVNSPLCATNVLTTVADNGREALDVCPRAFDGTTRSITTRSMAIIFKTARRVRLMVAPHPTGGGTVRCRIASVAQAAGDRVSSFHANPRCGPRL